jgi:hypothetical protein
MQLSDMGRVTRLAEFSPIGPLFSLGSFLKNTEVAQVFGLLFPAVKKYVLIFPYNGLGYTMSDFFSNLSGVDVMITIFCDFCQFSAKQLAFFSKTNVMSKFCII